MIVIYLEILTTIEILKIVITIITTNENNYFGWKWNWIYLILKWHLASFTQLAYAKRITIAYNSNWSKLYSYTVVVKISTQE